MSNSMANEKIKVGLSACLAGQEVRYNGGHCNSKLCMQIFSPYFEFKLFCLEVIAGFGIPRPTLRLSGNPDSPRLTFSNDFQSDLTGQFIEKVSPHLPGFEELDGYILMKNSPSCGLERIKVYQENGQAHKQQGKGLFTTLLQERYPLLPVEEEGRLHDDRLRENFILRVYTHHNFRQEVLAAPGIQSLLAFHSSYKYLVMAHSQTYYRQIGRLLADPHSHALDELITTYFELLMTALAHPASNKGHANVLLHIMGYLKKSVDGCSRQKITQTVDSYRRGEIPLITPLTLIKHYIDMKGNDYIQAQRYLQPYPAQLGLTNNL